MINAVKTIKENVMGDRLYILRLRTQVQQSDRVNHAEVSWKSVAFPLPVAACCASYSQTPRVQVGVTPPHSRNVEDRCHEGNRA